MKKLVSVVSPCYNGEDYISRYMDSILKQTYRPIEVILVNDGSADKTEEIINSYASVFERSDIILKVITKNNEGSGAAVNDGLKHITGEYLIWPDSDDFLFPESIEKRVKFYYSKVIWKKLTQQLQSQMNQKSAMTHQMK